MPREVYSKIRARGITSCKLAIAARLGRGATRSVRRIAERFYWGESEGARANLHRWLNRPMTVIPQTCPGI
jgi:hypothetical protein